MFLFKQTFKNILKEKINICIFIILIFILTMIIVVSWIINDRLNYAYIFMNNENIHYDYLLYYNSKKQKTSNLGTISPWFAFSNNYHEIINKLGEKYTLPILSLGGNNALQEININNVNINLFFKNSQVSHINFYAKNKLFGLNYINDGLYNFNINSYFFQNSLIGKLYLQRHLYAPQKQKEIINNINTFMNNFAYSDISKSTIKLFSNYLNNKYINPKLEYFWNKDKVIQNLLSFINFGKINWIKNIDLTQSNNLINQIPDITNIEKEIFLNGLNGNLSILYKIIHSPMIIHIGIYYGFNINNSLNENMIPAFNKYLKDAVFVINDFYNKNNTNYDFNDKRGKFGPYQLTKSFFLLVSLISNFNINMRETYEYWDLFTNIRYKIINWQQLIESKQLKLFSKYKYFNPHNFLNDVYVIISPQFAKNYNLKLGDLVTIGKNYNFFVGGIGGDTANVYPTIYNNDIFPNSELDAIVYVAPTVYRNNDKIADNNDIEDDSVVFLKYNDIKNKNKYINKFKKYLASDYKKLNNLNNITYNNLKSKQETKLIYARFSLLKIVIKIYYFTSIILISIFIFILILALSILIKKIINKDKIENGILKAHGYNYKYISCSYLLYSIFTTIIGVPIGWLLGVILQIPIIYIFNKYFIIPDIFLFNFKSLFVSFIMIFGITVVIIWLTAIKQLIVNPLNLLNNNININPNKRLKKIVTKINFKNFINKFRLVIFSVLLKKIIYFFLTFLIASLFLTFAILIPTSIKKISKNYYVNLNYLNEYWYTNVIGNIPLTRYHLYNWNGPRASNNPAYPIQKNSLISDYLNIGTVNQHYWLPTNKGDIIKHPEKYIEQLENMILFNFIAGKGSSLSIGSLYEISQKFKSKKKYEFNKIEEQIQMLLCNTLPRAFNKDPIMPSSVDPIERWTYCLLYSTNDFLPSKIRNMWLKDKYAKMQFNFTFGTTTYNILNEDVFTGFNSEILLNNNKKIINLATYGINKNNKTIIFPNKYIKNSIFNENNNFEQKKYIIPIIINDFINKKYNIKVNDILNVKVKLKQLKYFSKQGWKTINPQWWGYVDNVNIINDYSQNFKINNKINPFNIELSKLTIGKKQNNLYGFDNINHIKNSYYNLANFVLKIPINDINLFKWNLNISAKNGKKLPYLFDTTINENNVVYKKDNYFIIRPFDHKYDREISGIGDLINDDFPTNWYNAAFKSGFFNIKTEFKKIKYKVTGIQESYDIPRIYMSQNNANNILNYPDYIFRLYKNNKINPMSWFNGKFSKYKDQVDQTMRYNLSSNNGFCTVFDFINGTLTDAIKKIDYLGIKCEVISQLANILIILSIIFIIIIFITSLVIIYIMIDSFINYLIKFISIMKFTGYANWEINNLILGLLTPFIFIAWILGIWFMWLIIKWIIHVCSYLFNIIIPLQFPLLVIPLTFIFISIIYIITYIIFINKISKMNIQKQILINEI